MKRYTIQTNDDCQLKRAMLADDMGMVLLEFNDELRKAMKYEPNTHKQAEAEYWRQKLHDVCHDNGIVIDDLYE